MANLVPWCWLGWASGFGSLVGHGLLRVEMGHAEWQGGSDSSFELGVTSGKFGRLGMSCPPRGTKSCRNDSCKKKDGVVGARMATVDGGFGVRPGSPLLATGGGIWLDPELEVQLVHFLALHDKQYSSEVISRAECPLA